MGMFSCSKTSLPGLLEKRILVPFGKMRKSRNGKNTEGGAFRLIIMRSLQTLSSQKQAFQQICEATALSLKLRAEILNSKREVVRPKALNKDTWPSILPFIVGAIAHLGAKFTIFMCGCCEIHE